MMNSMGKLNFIFKKNLISCLKHGALPQPIILTSAVTLTSNNPTSGITWARKHATTSNDILATR